MKNAILPFLATLLLASCGGSQNEESLNEVKNETSTDMEKLDKEAITNLLNEYKNALNSSDPDLARSLYTKDGIFMPSEAPSAIGSDSIFASYDHIFSQIQLNIEFYIEEIQIEGDMAFAVTSSKGSTLIHATGDTIPEANRELFVFEKVDEKWRIARYMFNKTEPKA